MKADLGCVCAGDEPPGPYSTSTPLMLLPGTFGRACSYTRVTFALLSVAIPELTPTMSAQKISAQVKRGLPTDFEVRIRFIVMFFLVRGLAVLEKSSSEGLLQDARQTAEYLAVCRCILSSRCLLRRRAAEPLLETHRRESRV